MSFKEVEGKRFTNQVEGSWGREKEKKSKMMHTYIHFLFHRPCLIFVTFIVI